MRLLPWILSSACLALPIAGQDLSEPGPLSIGWSDESFPVIQPAGTASGRVYYPALAAGPGETPFAGDGPYPLVAMIHGINNSPDDYDVLCTHIASYGFVVLSVDGILSYVQLAQAADAMLEWFDAESQLPASPWYQMASDAPWSAVGHSWGGRALLPLIEHEPRVGLIIPLATVFSEEDLVVLESFGGDLLTISGSEDLVAPGELFGHELFVAAEQSQRNLYALMEGMDHDGPYDPGLGGDDTWNREIRRAATTFLRAEILELDPLYNDLVGPSASSQPIAWEALCQEPVLWAAPSTNGDPSGDLGVAAMPLQAVLLAVSIAPSSIPTPFGQLGIDLNAGFIFAQGLVASDGFYELPLALTPLSGATLYFQGLVSDTQQAVLTSVAVLTVP